MFITRRFDNNFYSSHFPERNPGPPRGC